MTLSKSTHICSKFLLPGRWGGCIWPQSELCLPASIHTPRSTATTTYTYSFLKKAHEVPVSANKLSAPLFSCCLVFLPSNSFPALGLQFCSVFLKYLPAGDLQATWKLPWIQDCYLGAAKCNYSATVFSSFFSNWRNKGDKLTTKFCNLYLNWTALLSLNSHLNSSWLNTVLFNLGKRSRCRCCMICLKILIKKTEMKSTGPLLAWNC